MNPEHLVPVEHRMTFLGYDPSLIREMRVRCQCGWTEKAEYMGSAMVEYQTQILRSRWLKHVYTPQQLCLLHELECGCHD